jgi:hypothetical protein
MNGSNPRAIEVDDGSPPSVLEDLGPDPLHDVDGLTA